MKTLRLALAMVMVLVAALVLTAPARADDQSAKRTPFFLISGSLVEIPPTEVIVHTENTIIRGGWYLWDITTSDPSVGGFWNIHGDNLILKTNHPTPYWGPGHGTWTMDSNRDGNVEWQGVVHIMPFTDNFITNYTGEGVGIYEGLQITMGDHDGVFTGEIFDPRTQ
jgi:hypothetical protein